ncbi:hypothetical protein [Ruminococcus gauvreauii]|uniref:Type II secretion system protein GspF domain-containing protein n=1 Tax=Ruminococcus gauvreauii TaxID=438033 RepID=A0ABY5VC31_9FIRM|nr:hypothetical protein [Ruminococcus gauvreauii]UWP58075.1 hypothetical protein NQ502_11805 [Ruminococcus gauvreauii]
MKEKEPHRKVRRPKEMVAEINRYGYRFSLSRFWRLILLAFAATGGVCLWFELHPALTAAVLLSVLMCMPKVMLSVYHSLYEQKRFADVNNYLEQMMFSFQKRPNILFCLKETALVFPEGDMGERLQRAISCIHKGESDRMYEEAFEIIEEGYGCGRVNTLHRFLIKVELYGGNYQMTLEILLEDRRMWIERVYALQQDKKRMKNKIFISVIFSSVICSLITFIVPRDFDIKGMMISQIVTCIFLIAGILIGASAQSALSGTWFTEMKESDPEKVRADYQTALSPDLKLMQSRAVRKTVCMLILGMIGWRITKHAIVPAVSLGAAILMLTGPGRTVAGARRRTVREIQKVFPGWVMELVLLLQTNNVFMSVEATRDRAPVILREPVRQLLSEMQAAPGSVYPYLHFLDDFDLPDVKTAMRMLYAMDETGTGNAEIQMNALIKRNNILLDKAERIQNEDRLAGTGMLVYLPMVTGTVKMMVDMILLIIVLTVKTGNLTW